MTSHYEEAKKNLTFLDEACQDRTEAGENVWLFRYGIAAMTEAMLYQGEQLENAAGVMSEKLDQVIQELQTMNSRPGQH